MPANYRDVLRELDDLYAKDKWGDALSDLERVRHSSQSNLEYARTALDKARMTRFNEPKEHDRAPRRSRDSSRLSSSHSSTSSVKANTLAKAAAAKKQAEYDRLVAEKELERRQCEAEEKRIREERRAKCDRDMALLAAERPAAVADSKLSAIVKSMEEDERADTPSRKDITENVKCRTQEWVDSQNKTEPALIDKT